MPSGRIETVYSDNRHFEAPNWSRDGRFFLINSGGRLYRLNVGAHELEPIETGFATRINNDHGISPDGRTLVLSHEPTDDWLTSSVYVLPIAGGTPRQITTKAPSFWYGWSPDGKTLAFIEDQGQNHPFGKQGKLRLMDLRDRSVRDLTPPFFGGRGTINVPSWSPDSRRVAFVTFEEAR